MAASFRQKKRSESSSNLIYRVVSDSVIAAAAVATAERIKTAPTRPGSVETAKCECCGLGEECTAGYVKRMQQQFCGHFLCGLCAEAVKEEHARLVSKISGINNNGDNGDKTIKFKSSDAKVLLEAINIHMNICKQFNCAVRSNPVAAATSAMRQLLIRRAGGGSPRLEKKAGFGLARSSSCIPAISASQATMRR